MNKEKIFRFFAISFMIYAILYYYCDVVKAEEILCNPPLIVTENSYIGNSHISQKENIEEIVPLYTLYSQPFSEDLYNTYQVITTTELNVRKGPGVKYDIYKSIPENEPVDIIIEEYPETGWIKVWVDCGEYFVYTKYLKVIKRNIYNE